MAYQSLTKTYHKGPYPAISPERPELSQAGKTILMTGGATGIGFAASRSFITANAARIIIVGRRKDMAEASAAKLNEEAKKMNRDTIITGQSCDISDTQSTEALWTGFAQEGIVIDVLVLSAAATGPYQTILEYGMQKTWKDYETNVRSVLDFVERFSKQTGQGANKGKVGEALNLMRWGENLQPY